MLSEPGTESKSFLRNPLLYTSAACLAALLAVGWIFLSRWQENRDIDRRAASERAEKQRESDRRALESLGGKDLAILNFYAIPETIRRGESTQLCYGVTNAKSVRLEPQSNPVWPSYSRCVDVSPRATTVYTLTISDDAGHTKTATAKVNVR
jgi:hypothetical protein